MYWAQVWECSCPASSTGTSAPLADVTETDDAFEVEASLDEGVLTIRVPKSDAAKPRRIQITGKK